MWKRRRSRRIRLESARIARAVCTNMVRRASTEAAVIILAPSVRPEPCCRTGPAASLRQREAERLPAWPRPAGPPRRRRRRRREAALHQVAFGDDVARRCAQTGWPTAPCPRRVGARRADQRQRRARAGAADRVGPPRPRGARPCGRPCQRCDATRGAARAERERVAAAGRRGAGAASTRRRSRSVSRDDVEGQCRRGVGRRAGAPRSAKGTRRRDWRGPGRHRQPRHQQGRRREEESQPMSRHGTRMVADRTSRAATRARRRPAGRRPIGGPPTRVAPTRARRFAAASVLPCVVHPDTLRMSVARPQIPRTVVVIPARYRSTRFPGKPLADLHGRPMIVHVIDRARLCRLVERVLVATDDARIADAVRAHGGEARDDAGGPRQRHRPAGRGRRRRSSATSS